MEHPEKDDFAFADEVTLRGGDERRPNLFLYLNGISIGIIKLKRSSEPEVETLLLNGELTPD